ncbi:uncharacterized protein LOC115412102 isoform X2 [Sphaeramia orbicularis]|uniref:uncharacterized protein LOC115412102 isoform X2 n=1 Tax=Sphaeramia orbicularis TaxID=375764 RepID=UPI0011808BFB|nr:uncharacterized protein LOC115412102 isoform X2 [Sphaeramia orbicularis]
MMDRRKALTIPFTVDKDNLMENPLRIPTSYLSPECGKLERQVSWTAFAGSKPRRHRDSQPRNGSMMFDHNHAALVKMGLARRKPYLVLTDVLKTELGRAFMEQKKAAFNFQNKELVSSRERRRCREQTPIYREKTLREAKDEKSKTVTPKRKQTTTPTSVRSRLKLKNDDDKEDKDENGDVQEVKIGKDQKEDYKVAEVIDCGLSLRWEHPKDTGHCKFTPNKINDKWTDPENDLEHSLKRKVKDAETQSTETHSPKRRRESVLRLSGTNNKDGGPAPTQICVEESAEDRDLENLGRGIVQFTVGDDENNGGALIPVTSPSSGDLNAAIVLSSDDEEGGEGTVTQKKPPDEAVTPQLEAKGIEDMQVLHVVVDEHSGTVALSPITTVDNTCLGLAFTTLYCGRYQGKANGDLLVTDTKIIMPLKDISKQVEVILSMERKELKKYSIWDHDELEDRGFFCKGNKKPPPAIVLLYVSETAATALQCDLSTLGAKEDGNKNTEKPSPFVLLTLKDNVEGMMGALLRSLLDIDCLNSLANENSIMDNTEYSFSGLDFTGPVLSLDDSVELIRRTGLDPHLLKLLGQEGTVLGLETDLDCPQLETDLDCQLETDLDCQLETDLDCSQLETDLDCLQLETDLDCPQLETDLDCSQLETELDCSQLETELDCPQLETDLDCPQLETDTPAPIQSEVEPKQDSIGKLEHETKLQIQPEVNQKQQDHEHPSEKSRSDLDPVYTLCHRRLKGSYSVSLCESDSSWVKYKHQGLPQRLIQFPPPPLKGGITVTMEDLQCLDSGQYLNDVIIDFYLKYLLQNASEAVAERSHIFSSFFYKQLTRRDNASEGSTSDSCQRQRRHQRVKTWTRHVDIFNKDFLFVPVNQEAHWYLVVICFPGLNEPKQEIWTPDSQSVKNHSGSGELQHQDEAQGYKSPNNNTEALLGSNSSENPERENSQEQCTKDTLPGPVNCTEQTCPRKTICKRPCILVMDSLKRSLHERVFKLLRDYLLSEWETRRGSSKDFGPDQMKSSHCQVPLQDNNSDCGLYLLQYVESFLKDPVVHFDLPLQLKRWFPRQQVRRKRDEIRDLVLKLYRHQNLDNKR